MSKSKDKAGVKENWKTVYNGNWGASMKYDRLSSYGADRDVNPYGVDGAKAKELLIYIRNNSGDTNEYGHNMDIYYVKYFKYSNGGSDYIKVLEYQISKPNPNPPQPPEKKTYYHHTQYYIPNQLMGFYQGRHKVIAELKEDGRINWKTTPDLRLYRNGEEVGKIIHIRDGVPNTYKVYTADLVDPHKLHTYTLTAKPPHGKSRYISHNDPDGTGARDILTNPNGEGFHALTWSFSSSYISDLRRYDFSSYSNRMEFLPGLHGPFNNQMVTEEVKNEKGQVIERRYLNQVHQRKSNPLFIQPSSGFPKQTENRTDVFTIKKK